MRRDARRREQPANDVITEPISAAVFKDEVSVWAARLEVQPGEIRLAGMRRKWASCSPHGRVTFDATLLSQPEEFRREVIIHELLHLKVPNHGALFRALLQAHIGADERSK
jgi:hypothetical protein